ncbi:hypothetical protein [Gallaecimonas sp. GXIMD4217]|uniref:hypothetical protein n=1 Tax=Gallaecimonas sp. GXIMD4217 TaxID=3131927 RepID=UPI00311B2A87
MNTVVETAPRPVSITVICIFGFIGALFTLPLLFSSIPGQIGAWYPPYLAFSTLIGLACMLGLWLMKKWAAYAYTLMVVVNQVVMLAMGVWNILALLIPAVIIFFALKHAPRMS